MDVKEDRAGGDSLYADGWVGGWGGWMRGYFSLAAIMEEPCAKPWVVTCAAKLHHRRMVLMFDGR